MPEISEKAIYYRVKRRLAHDGLRILICPERSRGFSTLGRFYTVNDRNHIENYGFDLTAYARDLGVLRDGEMLAAG